MQSLSFLEIYSRMFSAALFSVQPYHPATKYMQTVYGGGMVCFGDHILEGFYTLYVTRCRTYKIV